MFFHLADCYQFNSRDFLFFLFFMDGECQHGHGKKDLLGFHALFEACYPSA